MAYNRLGLRKFAYTQGATPAYSRRMWCYVSATDTLAAIAAPGYLYDPECDLGVGDRVFVEGSNGHRELIVTSVAGGNIVLGNTDDANRLDLLETLIVTLQPAGHGAMIMSDGPDDDADLGASWAPMDMMNTINVPERGIDLTVDSGDFSFTTAGVWELMFQISFSHNSSASDSRTTYLRLYDDTDDAEVIKEAVTVNRNALDTSASIILAADVAESNLTDTFRFEIGGGEVITTIVWNKVSLKAFYHGSLGALILPGA